MSAGDDAVISGAANSASLLLSGCNKTFEAAKQCFFEGLRLLEANNLQGAETQLERSLEFIPQRVSTLNNLSAVKIKLSKFGEAEQLARTAVAIESKSPEAWANLATALIATDRLAEALPACDRALDCNPSYAMAWLVKAMALSELKRFDEALAACDEALKLESNKYEFLYHKSLVLKDLNRLSEAEGVYRKALNIRIGTSPVYFGERRATQKAEILIINRKPQFDGSFWSFEFLNRFCPNFPGQLADRLSDDFHFNYIFIDEALQPEARKQIPQPDLILNNHTNGEVLVSEGGLIALSSLIESFRVPVVNHPGKAVQTVRDISAKQLERIPGVLVPKTARFSSIGKTPAALADEIGNQFDYPLITRTTASQQGEGMNKIDSRDALVGVLSAGCPEQFLVTQFIDSRGEDGLHRKIRAAVVRDEIIFTRVDYDTFWNVHGRKSEKRVPFYLERPHLLDEEKRIINDPETALGRSALLSLLAIRDRIPLDIFGIDFAVDPNGRIVFYEANGTMNLFSTANKLVPNPKEGDERLKLALQRYFSSLVIAR